MRGRRVIVVVAMHSCLLRATHGRSDTVDRDSIKRLQHTDLNIIRNTNTVIDLLLEPATDWNTVYPFGYGCISVVSFILPIE